MFVYPLMDLDFIFALVDDNYVPKTNCDLTCLVEDMERSLEAITIWLRDSSLEVNQNKTDLCLFFKKDCVPVIIKNDNTRILSTNQINVLGVIFDSKLQWGSNIRRAIAKSNKASNAIELTRNYFTSAELIQLLTCNYNSVLCYNSEIWLMKSLHNSLKHSLLTASACKVALHYSRYILSYQDLHILTNRATPLMITECKLTLQLFKNFNNSLPQPEWIQLNLNQQINTRQTHF
jgi:hypothetical protein